MIMHNHARSLKWVWLSTMWHMAELADFRRLRLRTIATRGSDDLRGLGRHKVSDKVATEAVVRLRRRGVVMLVAGLVSLAGFVVGLTVLGAATERPGVVQMLAVALVAPGLLIPSGAVGTVRWSRRLGSVREHGWRPGRASVVRSRTYSAGPAVWLNDPPRPGAIRIRATLPGKPPVPDPRPAPGRPRGREPGADR